MQDPGLWLGQIGVEVECAVRPERTAFLDAGHRTWVNREVYFFSGPEEKATFLADVIEHCGPVTDPVTRMRFRPDESSPLVRFEGRPFYFSSDSTLAIFSERPWDFLVPPSELGM